MNKWAYYTELALGGLKYAMSALTILGGIVVMFTSVTPASGPLGFLYGTRVGLVFFGLFTASCGISLLYGKLTRSKKWTGIGLMACYMCFMFATIIQILSMGLNPLNWIFNGIFCLISGALWLRWKFKTSYINPKHFRRDIIDLQ